MQKNGVSPFQNMCAYFSGSAIQTVGDNLSLLAASLCSSTSKLTA